MILKNIGNKRRAGSVDDSDDFRKTVAQVENKIGKTLLTDEDVIVLACREIARTYTLDEKNYT
jgi:uncharacterized protein YpuA (DUF1002 family)